MTQQSQLATPEQSFLQLPDGKRPSYDESKAVVIPYGLEASVSYGGGTARGPAAMIAASPELELFDEELWYEPHQPIGIATLAAPAIPDSLPEALDQLEQMVAQVLDDGKFPLIFGGEHALTAGAIRPFASRHQDLAILHFDAHADLRDGYLGEHYSHASALRRCLDDAAVAQHGHHITLVSCGIRNISTEEIPFYEMNQERLHIHWANDKPQWNVEDIVAPLRGRPVYLSFDVDGFDASLMPATGTPEPGGLFWDDAMTIIREAAKVSTIMGADVNELAPIARFHSCDFTAAKLAYKILAYRFHEWNR